MKAAHTVLYMKKHTQTYASYPAMDRDQLYERGVDLEVEGVRYIEMHRGPAAYVLGPPPSRSRDLVSCPAAPPTRGKERLVDIETKLGPKTSYPVLVECNLRAR